MADMHGATDCPICLPDECWHAEAGYFGCPECGEHTRRPCRTIPCLYERPIRGGDDRG